MPWWGWVIIGVVAIIVTPIKLRIMKKMMEKKKQEYTDEY